MTDIERAKNILKSNDFTCVICKDDKVFKSTQRGIVPLILLIENNADLSGFSAADKIVGKAAAMLYSYLKVKEIYAEVMSNAAIEYLKKINISFSYNEKCERIINRKKDGICPMEQTVENIDNLNDALFALKQKLVLLKGKNMMKKLGFGFMRLPLLDGNDPVSFDKEQICKMVDTFIEKGFTYFDTAYMYHNGKSENVIKEVLVERHERNSFLLATKLPTMFLKENEDMERIFNEQLEKCGVEYFDYYLLHCLNKENYETTQRLGAFEFALNKKSLGQIKKSGFSFHDSAELLDKILTEHPETEFVQLQINYLDWESDEVQSRKCYEVAVKHGKEVIVMEPVKGGSLANVPPKAESLLKENNPSMSVASWAIRFAAGLPNVITVLSGMSNMQQLSDNIGYMENFVPLSKEETEICMKTADIINASITVNCTKCRYCVDDCPMHIAIPEYFSLLNAQNQEIEKPFTVQEILYENLNQTNGKASDCIECGQCERHCPQHLNIIQRLKDVAKVFE